MRKIILSGFIVILSLSFISCNNSSENESANSNQSTRKSLKTYFITTNKEENTDSNWVFGESNENPLEEKEDTNKKGNVAIENSNKNKPVENNTTAPKPQNNNTTNNNTTTNNNNNYSPDPNYNMNNTIPGPYDENSNPTDSSADPNDIVSDPYANEGNDSSDDEYGYKEAEDRTFGNEPD